MGLLNPKGSDGARANEHTGLVPETAVHAMGHRRSTRLAREVQAHDLARTLLTGRYPVTRAARN